MAVDGNGRPGASLQKASDSHAPARRTTSSAKWFSGPTATAVAFFLGAVGTIWGFVSYFLSIQAPDLTCLQQPVHTVLIQAGVSSKITAQYDGKPLNSGVSATQVAVWNDGNLEVRRKDVLRPIVLRTKPEVTILEANVRYTTREVVGVTVHTDTLNSVIVDFEILEPGDGTIVQLIYAGPPGAEVDIAGVVVGQNEIRKAELSSRLRNAEYKPSSAWSRVARLAINAVFLFVFSGSMLIWFGASAIVSFQGRAKSRWMLVKAVLQMLAALFFVLVLVLLLRDASGYGPPFQF